MDIKQDMDTKIEGIDTDLLRRYIKVRHLIDQDKNTIYAISSILSSIKYADDSKLQLDPYALACVNELMQQAVLNMWETLDDFIPVASARLDLEEREASKLTAFQQRATSSL